MTFEEWGKWVERYSGDRESHEMYLDWKAERGKRDSELTQMNLDHMEAEGELREQVAKLIGVLEDALCVFPDSQVLGETGDWCWDELSSDAQDMVENIRNKVCAILAKVREQG